MQTRMTTNTDTFTQRKQHSNSNPTCSSLTFRRSLFTDMHDLIAVFSLWKFNNDSIIAVHETMTFLNIAWGDFTTNFNKYLQHFRFYILVGYITRNAFDFQTIPSWILDICPALPFHINYPVIKECINFLNYTNFWLKLNKIFVKFTNFLQSISVRIVICFNLVLTW